MYSSGGFLFGVFLHSVVSAHVSLLILLPVFSMSALLACIFIHINKKLLYVGFLLIGICLGVFRYSQSIETYEQHVLDIFVNQKELISIVGKIDNEPIYSGNQIRFNLKTELVQKNLQDHLAVDTNILVRAYTNQIYDYGNIVRIRSVIQKPESFETDTQRIFDYQTYLAKDNIYYIARADEISLVEEGKASLKKTLYRSKQKLLAGIYRYLPQPESGLLTGVLFGEPSALDEDTEEAFRRVGLMHIVVLSGYNVALVIFALMSLLSFLPMSLRSVCIVLGIITFAILVGAGPTVIRASIMAMFIVLGRVLHMRYDVTRALIFAGIIMVLINPKILLFDISFQLSFLASYGLIRIAPLIEKYFLWIPSIFVMRESAITTISAQIFVLPLLLYKIGEFSIIAPLINVLVLFAVPVSMLFGFGLSVSSLFSGGLAQIFGFFSYYALHYQLVLVNFFARLPLASVKIPKFHWIFMIVLYGLIFYWMHFLENKDLQSEKM
jgi:competence protein ComEC